MSASIRDARDGDGAGLIDLIGACWSEYPGCILDVDGEVPELRAIASHYAAAGGRFWVAEDSGRIVGSIGYRPAGPAIGELCKLYVARAARRRGLATALVALVEAAARSNGDGMLELWTDTRFLDAHRLYERLGFQRRSETRVLGDLSNSIEFHYRKPM